MILFCRRRACGKGYASAGEVPPHCPACGQPTKWGTSPAYTDQMNALTLTAEDRRFRRSLRIEAE